MLLSTTLELKPSSTASVLPTVEVDDTALRLVEGAEGVDAAAVPDRLVDTGRRVEKIPIIAAVVAPVGSIKPLDGQNVVEHRRGGEKGRTPAADIIAIEVPIAHDRKLELILTADRRC